jgi:hypothetical protein
VEIRNIVLNGELSLSGSSAYWSSLPMLSNKLSPMAAQAIPISGQRK